MSYGFRLGGINVGDGTRIGYHVVSVVDHDERNVGSFTHATLPVSTGHLCFRRFLYTHGNYTRYRYLVLAPINSPSAATYGVRVFDTNNNIVFDSGLKYTNIYQQIYTPAPGKNAVTPYYSMGTTPSSGTFKYLSCNIVNYSGSMGEILLEQNANTFRYQGHYIEPGYQPPDWPVGVQTIRYVNIQPSKAAANSLPIEELARPPYFSYVAEYPL